MFDRIANVEPDSETRTKAIDLILREICRKYKEKQDPNFSQEELHDLLRGYRTIYLDENFRKLLRGSELVGIDDNFNLTLTDIGKQFCKDRKW
jgi:hypothetical protein